MGLEQLSWIASLAILAGSAFYSYDKVKEKNGVPPSKVVQYMDKSHQGIKERNDWLIVANDGCIFAKASKGVYRTVFDSHETYSDRNNDKLKKKGIRVRTIMPNEERKN